MKRFAALTILIVAGALTPASAAPSDPAAAPTPIIPSEPKASGDKGISGKDAGGQSAAKSPTPDGKQADGKKDADKSGQPGGNDRTHTHPGTKEPTKPATNQAATDKGQSKESDSKNPRPAHGLAKKPPGQKNGLAQKHPTREPPKTTRANQTPNAHPTDPAKGVQTAKPAPASSKTAVAQNSAAKPAVPSGGVVAPARQLVQARNVAPAAVGGAAKPNPRNTAVVNGSMLKRKY